MLSYLTWTLLGLFVLVLLFYMIPLFLFVCAKMMTYGYLIAKRRFDKEQPPTTEEKFHGNEA